MSRGVVRTRIRMGTACVIFPDTNMVDTSTNWRAHLVEDDDRIRRIIEQTHRIAVLGIKTPESDQSAYQVPEYLQKSGFEIVPVPVYYPDVTEILGQRVYRTLAAIPGPVDLVDVFRRPKDIPAHLDDIIAKRPRAVWFQQGIRHDDAAARLAREGIDVVQDHCLMIEVRRIGR